MAKNPIYLTVAQFARLHEVNKRTLHYYDQIGIFSPSKKGENGYRYYDSSQSISFEYIRMLKDLNMSMEELGAFIRSPDMEIFIQIAEEKEKEIDDEMKRLKHTKKILRQKKEQLLFCRELKDQEIRIQEFGEEKLLIVPFDFSGDNVSDIFAKAKENWDMEQIRMGVGSYISLDKVLDNDFEVYDGIFSPAFKHSAHSRQVVKPGGSYLCGYKKGSWDKIPEMYRNMADYAKENNINLTGYAYELGLNELAAFRSEDYVTQIAIKIKD